jgi:cobalamin biosynthesis protein CobC
MGNGVTKPVVHGGDLGDVRRRFPDAPQPWIDLSTGINPMPYPLPPLSTAAWHRLPTSIDEVSLLKTAADRYGVRDLGAIVAAPGTQALIQLLPRLMPKSRVAVLGPTYEEHEVCWRRQGHNVAVVADLSGVKDADVAVVVNPDNPTGRLIPRAELLPPKRLLVVDEAFIDFEPPSTSLATDLPPRTVVLRSFGKTYGLAGLRLGFAIAERALAERLHEELGPWAVSGPALEIGRTALGDANWMAADRLRAVARRLDDLLHAGGFVLMGGTTLFRLASHARAACAVTALARHGIHVRSFAQHPTLLRFGLPADEAQFERLASALSQFRTGGGPAASEPALPASSQTR